MGHGVVPQDQHTVEFAVLGQYISVFAGQNGFHSVVFVSVVVCVHQFWVEIVEMAAARDCDGRIERPVQQHICQIFV